MIFSVILQEIRNNDFNGNFLIKRRHLFIMNPKENYSN